MTIGTRKRGSPYTEVRTACPARTMTANHPMATERRKTDARKRVIELSPLSGREPVVVIEEVIEPDQYALKPSRHSIG